MKRSLSSALLLALLSFAAPTASSPSEDEATAALPASYQRWLAEVELLISEEELEAFLALQKDYQRDAFIEEFWRQRDPYPSTARNEFRDRWRQTMATVLAEFGSAHDARARVMLINGEPDGRWVPHCAPLWPLELWIYANTEGYEELPLLFYQRFNQGAYRLWDPRNDGLAALTRFMSGASPWSQVVEEVETMCADSDRILGAASFLARQDVLTLAMVTAKLETPEFEPASSEWVATFNSYSTDIPAGAETFPAEVRIEFPGRHQSRTVIQASLWIEPSVLGIAELAGSQAVNLAITGDILRQGKLFDNFHYQFNVDAGGLIDDRVVLVFERKLRPGEYRLILRAEDLNTHRVFRSDQQLEVPVVTERMAAKAPDANSASLMAAANATLDSGDHAIRIIPPASGLLSGLARFNTHPTGDIAAVEFVLDERSRFHKRSPPFSIEVDLGRLPRARTLTVIAFDADGSEVARDTLLINGGSHRFDVELLQPRPGRHFSESLRAIASVTAPEGGVIERVEFFLNERLVSALYQPPWEQPIALPPGQQVGYVRAVAYQPDGNSTEDVVFINAPDFLEEVDVQFVELFVTVVDRAGRPAEGLTEEQFSMTENGVAQNALRFDRVTNLPIHAGILVDVSASMRGNLPVAQRAALGFFQQAIREQDRAALITFNDHPGLAVRFTNKVDAFAAGLAGLEAMRGTALYDAVIFALHYFNGITGQRALVVLSDGEDESSRYSLEDALEYARRAGVAIYPIGLQSDKKGRAGRRALSELARETGGQAFFIESISEIESIYMQIQEELRSRYYLAYQSTDTSGSQAFRRVEVKMDERSLSAKTLSGYYP